MRFKKIGSYKSTGPDGKDQGYHLECLDSPGYQTVSFMLFGPGQIEPLSQGKTAEIPWLFESDLLMKIEA